MGEPTDRITSADFVTPPEFSKWRLAANPAGRIGGVRLELYKRYGRTQLGTCYQQVPLRVHPLYLGEGQPFLLYLLNPTAGLMDGDGQLIDIVAGPDTRAVIIGQSASRLHPAVYGFSTQQWRVTAGPGSVIVILPGPAIPYRDCRYFQRAHINLDPTAHIVWGDVWFAGRYQRGGVSERFRFDALIQDLCVLQGKSLIYRDRFCWRGPWDERAAYWHFGGQPVYGSLFATTAGLHGLMNLVPLPTAHRGCCGRSLGTAEDVVQGVIQTALATAAVLAERNTGGPWLLSGNHLAPTHWFHSVSNSAPLSERPRK